MYRDTTAKELDSVPDKLGELFQAKCALVAADILEALYVDMTSSETAVSLRLEGLKLIARLANLEPKAQQGTTQVGYSIQIVPPEGFGVQSLTIEGKAVVQDPSVEVPGFEIPIAAPPADLEPIVEPAPLLAEEVVIEGTPPKVVGDFKLPDFDLTEIFGA